MDDISQAETSGRAAFITPQDKVIRQRLDVYQISGNSYTILEHVRKVRELPQYPYLKINVMGTQTKNFSYGCLYFLITLIVIFFFPIFCLCSDCCKKRIYNLFNIDQEVYQSIGDIIAYLRPTECYIVVQDNYLNETKCSAISRGLQQASARKLELINIASGFNTVGHNYSDFGVYCRQLKTIVGSLKCRWGNQSV